MNAEVLVDEHGFRGFDQARVASDEAYAANCLRINDWVLVAQGFPTVEQQIRSMGYSTIVLDMSEFQKMDGGPSCLSLRQ